MWLIFLTVFFFFFQFLIKSFLNRWLIYALIEVICILRNKHKKRKGKKKGFNKMTHYKPYSKFMIDFKERYIANYITYDKHIL